MNFDNLNDEEQKFVLEVLRHSFRSEDPKDYGGEDSWGPAMGAAAHEAKIFNKELTSVLKKIKPSFKKQRKPDLLEENSKKIWTCADGKKLRLREMEDSHVLNAYRLFSKKEYEYSYILVYLKDELNYYDTLEIKDLLKNVRERCEVLKLEIERRNLKPLKLTVSKTELEYEAVRFLDYLSARDSGEQF